MSKSANPSMIGAFVLGAAAIAVGAIVFFGKGNPFAQPMRFVSLFRESVDGLQKGSRVTLKGVPIGQVDDILVRFEMPNSDHPEPWLSKSPSGVPLIPVIFSIDPGRVTDTLGSTLADDINFHRVQVNAGLRGQLKTSSLITGMLSIDLDYYPEAAPRSSNDPEMFSLGSDDFFVIPSLPSELTSLKEQAYKTINRLSEIDIAKVGKDLASLIENLNRRVDEFDTKTLNRAIAAMEETAQSLDAGKAVSSIESAAKKVGEAADALSGTVESWEIEELITDSREALAALTTTASDISGLVDDDSGTRQRLDITLEKLAEASAEIEELAAYLKMNPNSIIFGRKEEKIPTDESTHTRSRPPSFNRPGR